MNRLFGSGTKAPKVSLQNVIDSHDNRAGKIDVRIAEINNELAKYNEKLSKLREGPGKQAIKRRALDLLKKRRGLEQARDQQTSQSWNLEQTQMMQDNMKGVMATVDALKTTNKELKKQYGKVDLDKIERLQDEMADLMDVGNEIQESLSRGYDVPDDVDEAELDAELEMLGAEMEAEGGMGVDAGGVPDFLKDEMVPDFIDEPPEAAGKVQEAAR
ncbi:hypothetical protein PG996_003828 [Apiospora saccharicola]|uniref:Charged multivesicular body protein 5 n=1 Tax=Apiospora saccharicola TaxID=335842 RepID=A0ABR1W696_9PEZI